jgi:hypothetical protein
MQTIPSEGGSDAVTLNVKGADHPISKDQRAGASAKRPGLVKPDVIIRGV